MQLWTQEHAVTVLPAFVVMLVLSAVLRRLLGDKPLKIRMIPIQIIACLILVLEIGKQGVSLWRGYDLYHLPFHFCSLFIFMLPIMAFYKGKHREKIFAITAALCMSVLLLMLIYPNLIYSAGNIRAYFTDYMSFHTVTFHNLVMLAAVLIPVLRVHTPAPKGEIRTIIWYTVGFCAVSATMAHLLKTNYANYYSCNIPVLETVRLAVEQTAGAIPAKALYILIVSLLNVAFVYGAYWLYRLLRRIICK